MEMKYNLLRPWETLDDWQKEVLATKGNICMRTGRQVGKSAIVSIKAGDYALNNPNKTIMVIAKVERQAQLLFEKILHYIHFKDKNAIKKGKDRPTKHKLTLKNGAIIHCLPAGDTGWGIMGFTIDLLIADEAAFIPEEVWNSVIPTLTITRGNIWLLSTPYIKEGYYYECFQDESFTNFHMSSEDSPRRDDEFLANKKKRMTKGQYAQMYLGQFVDDLKRIFLEELIKKCCILERPKEIRKGRDYFLGVDIARMGEDESTFEIIDRTDRKKPFQVESITTRKTLLTATTKKILQLNEDYNFKQIFVDDGGMGVGVFDQLLDDNRTKRKVVAINNASRPLTRDEKKKKKVIKTDIYANLVRLMERGDIKLLDDDEVKASLRSMLWEQEKEEQKMRIWGNDAHIADGLVRAAWCVKEKSLNIYCY